jgi:DNA-binding GntR family transcriptional regulator
MLDCVIKSEEKSVDISTGIAQDIQDLITRGTLSSGVRLGQTTLAERFNVSRTQIREALQTLAAEGIVIHDPYRGYFVTKISSDEVRDLYRMRHLFERDLLATIDWPTTVQLVELKNMINEIESIVAQQKFDLWHQAHRQFEMMIFNLSPNKIFAREIFRLWALIDRYGSLLAMAMPQKRELAKNKLTEMRRLLGCLMKHDRKGLLRIFERERLSIEQMFISILESRGL